MPLTDIQCRSAKAGAKPQKLADGKGLYLYVAPNGSKLWRQDYSFRGKRRTASFGKYPTVGLAQARQQAAALKDTLTEGRDPALLESTSTAPTFEVVGRQWFAANRAKWKTSYSARFWRRVENDMFPVIGALPVDDVPPQKILEALRAVEQRDANYTARRLHQMTNQIFKFAIVEGHTRFNPAADLHVALKPVPKVEHRAALKEADLPEFFVRLERTPMDEPTRFALKAVAHVFVRTEEIRYATWTEFDFDGSLWAIPAERMKMKREFKVPLSRQAKAIFLRLRELAGDSQWVLPAERGNKPVSENCLLYALYRCGYHRRATVHGFRSTFSTIANDSELWEPDAIEHQLAHAPNDAIRAAYDRGERWQSRVKMMQWYSDKLEAIEKKALANDFADLLG